MAVRSLTGWFKPFFMFSLYSIEIQISVLLYLPPNGGIHLLSLFEEGRGKTRGWGGLQTKFFRGQSDSVLQESKQEDPGLKRGNGWTSLRVQWVHFTATQSVATKDRTMRKIQTIDTSEAVWSSVSSNKTTGTTSQEVSFLFILLVHVLCSVSAVHLFLFYICSWFVSWIIRWTFFIHSFFLSARTNDAN